MFRNVSAVAAVLASVPASGSLGARLAQPLPLLLLQVLVILATARGVGAVFARMGQPRVVGEMVAGIVLGPSLLGALLPSVEAFVFPQASLGPLQLLSQVGVVLFMFLVGVELDLEHLRQRAATAVVTSVASIVAPFLLGGALARFLYPELAPPGVPFAAFALFIAVAMSITAFPVLARILEERGLTATSLGVTALACAAVGDAIAWCLLALVVAFARAEAVGGAAATVAFAAAFVALVVGVVRPLLARFAVRTSSLVASEAGERGFLAAALVFVFACAIATEAIGVHALFGAFLAGVAIPSASSWRETLERRLDAFGSVLLLPLFFAFTGLRTRVGLLDDARAWLVCGVIVAVAIAGKLGGAFVASRATGLSSRDAFALGALMNTRGLVELVVLGVGYDLGILSQKIFAMLVLMALATTMMAGPLLSRVGVGSRPEIR